jgi:valyl-tRNA synthetase
MDDISAAAVREAFLRLYRAGLAYRTEALVNWCPGCRTSVSDLEVISTPETGTLWAIRYHLVDRLTGDLDPDRWIAVATTRPETILGDTAVAVHPDDDRYRDLIGKMAVVPVLGRRIPVIADEAVDMEFGTGALKITPGHDPNDYEIGERHGLEIISMLDQDARVTGGSWRVLWSKCWSSCAKYRPSMSLRAPGPSSDAARSTRATVPPRFTTSVSRFESRPAIVRCVER